MKDKSFVEKTLSLAKAVWKGQDVPHDVIQKRLEICKDCDLVGIVGDVMKCTICGCKLKERGLQNLARYEETKEYGCKHPEGSKWKKNGV